MRIYQRLAQTIGAYKNCLKNGNKEWQARHEDTIKQIEKNLPSGSGIDCGTTIDIEKSTDEKIVLNMSFHHMNEHGYYVGWTEHAITFLPSFHDGIMIGRIMGRNKNQIKDYLADTYYHAITLEE